MSDAAPSRTHNQPPSPLPLIETEGLRDDLKRDWGHLDTSAKAVVEVGKKWLADHPRGVTTAAQQAEGTDVLGKIMSEIDIIDKDSSHGIRSEVVGPLNKAVKTVNDFFREIVDPLRTVRDQIKAPMDAWARAEQKRRNDEARQRQLAAQRQAEDEARQRQIDAQQLAALAQETGDDDALDAAILAEQAAMEAAEKPQVAAQAPSTARVYGDAGTSSNLVGRWKWRVINEAAVPRQYLMVNPDAVAAALKGSRIRNGPPSLQIPGIESYQESSLSVKRPGG